MGHSCIHKLQIGLGHKDLGKHCGFLHLCLWGLFISHFAFSGGPEEGRKQCNTNPLALPNLWELLRRVCVVSELFRHMLQKMNRVTYILQQNCIYCAQLVWLQNVVIFCLIYAASTMLQSPKTLLGSYTMSYLHIFKHNLSTIGLQTFWVFIFVLIKTKIL